VFLLVKGLNIPEDFEYTRKYLLKPTLDKITSSQHFLNSSSEGYTTKPVT
jgi:hypothetical protein